MNSKVDSSESQAIKDEIAELELKLQDANRRLNAGRSNGAAFSTPPFKVLSSEGMG